VLPVKCAQKIIAAVQKKLEMLRRDMYVEITLAKGSPKVETQKKTGV